jgi:HAD superfamily phosphoserine phosphatase-like hydrolase
MTDPAPGDVILRPVAVSDIDGTLFRRQTIEMLTKAFIDHRVFPATLRRPFTELTKHLRDSRIDYVEYDLRLIGIYLSGMTGANAEDVTRVSRIVAEENGGYVYAFTRLFLERFAATHQRIAITGANDHVMRHLGPAWGFEHVYGTVLEVKDGFYTGGEVSVPVRDKARALRAHIDAGHAVLDGSVGIGDTASDISMLAMVTYPVAFNPDFDLRQAARRHHWPIVTEKKNAIVVQCCGHDVDFHRNDASAAVDHVINLRGCACPHG